MSASLTTLENGVRVVTEAVPSARSVSIGVLVGVSPRHDPPELLGLAHLTEHAVFLGTAQRDALEIARLMDQAGGQIGAFTTRDYTCFFANVLADYLPYALDLLGNLLVCPTFPAEAIDLEKQTITREIEGDLDDPAGRVHQQLKASVWGGHPLGRPIMGRVESVDRITRDDVVGFHASRYLPDQIVVAISGAVDHEPITDQVRDAFWSLRGTSEPHTSKPEFQSASVFDVAETHQSCLAVGIPGIPQDHHDRFKLHIFNAVLGGGLSSRLFRQLRERRGLAYRVEAAHDAYMDAGILCIEAATSADGAEVLASAVLDELEALASGSQPVTEEEFWTARMRSLGQHSLSGEELPTRTSRLLTRTFYSGRPQPDAEIISALESLTAADLNVWIRKSLPPALAHASVAVLTSPHYARLTADSVTELLATFRLQFSPVVSGAPVPDSAHSRLA